MIKTIILVANEDEANKLSADNLNCEVIITGEGRVNVIKTLTRCIKEGKITDDNIIINVGYVGAKGFNIGDVVVVDEVGLVSPSTTIKEHDVYTNDGKVLPIEIRAFTHTKCFTSKNFVNHDEAIDLPNECVCDMELYWIALMFSNVLSLKIVSDTLNYNEYKDAQLHESWSKVYVAIKNLIEGVENGGK